MGCPDKMYIEMLQEAIVQLTCHKSYTDKFDTLVKPRDIRSCSDEDLLENRIQEAKTVVPHNAFCFALGFATGFVMQAICQKGNNDELNVSGCATYGMELLAGFDKFEQDYNLIDE